MRPYREYKDFFIREGMKKVEELGVSENKTEAIKKKMNQIKNLLCEFIISLVYSLKINKFN